MNLLLEKHQEILQNMIGQTIEYCLIPNLSISNLEVYPAANMYNENYGHFYSSELINLRLENSKHQKSWVKLCPGPDEDIEPWAPFWVEELTSPDFASSKIDNRIYSNEYEQLENDQLPSPQNLNNFLDSYQDGLGLNRCDFWGGVGPITSIEVFQFSPYAACLIKHGEEFEWTIYAEFDFDFWINFSPKMAKGIKENSESSILIK